MGNLKSFIFKNIVTICVITGFIGILIHLIDRYYMFHHGQALILHLFSIVSFDNLSTPFFNVNFTIGSTYNLLVILFFVMLISGGYIYKKTNGKDTRLIRFVFSIIFVHQMLNALFGILNILKSFDLINTFIPSISGFGLGLHFTQVVYSFLIGSFSYLITMWMLENQRLSHNLLSDSPKENELHQLKKAPNKKRFLHLIFDFIIMLLLFRPLFIVLIYLFQMERWQLANSNNLIFQILIMVGLTIYYLIYEGLFSATPIKFLTGTTVIDETANKKPGLGKIIGRTLSRRIPFDAFSFLSNNGWHDTISGTTVVSEESSERSKSYHIVWLWLFLIIALLPFIYYELILS